MADKKITTIRENKQGKGRYDLLPPYAFEDIAKRFEFGSVKYADRGWEKGLPCSQFVDSAYRHLCQFMQGMNDEDHLAASCCNLMMLIDTLHRIKKGKITFNCMDLPIIPYHVKTECQV